MNSVLLFMVQIYQNVPHIKTSKKRHNYFIKILEMPPFPSSTQTITKCMNMQLLLLINFI